jgi:hypothetical protein
MFYRDDQNLLTIRFDTMSVTYDDLEEPELMAVFSFCPVTRKMLIKVFHKSFAHMVPFGMRSDPHKYLVLQEFSGAYWFHLPYYFPAIP